MATLSGKHCVVCGNTLTSMQGKYCSYRCQWQAKHSGQDFEPWQERRWRRVPYHRRLHDARTEPVDRIRQLRIAARLYRAIERTDQQNVSGMIDAHEMRQLLLDVWHMLPFRSIMIEESKAIARGGNDEPADLEAIRQAQCDEVTRSLLDELDLFND